MWPTVWKSRKHHKNSVLYFKSFEAIRKPCVRTRLKCIHWTPSRFGPFWSLIAPGQCLFSQFVIHIRKDMRVSKWWQETYLMSSIEGDLLWIGDDTWMHVSQVAFPLGFFGHQLPKAGRERSQYLGSKCHHNASYDGGPCRCWHLLTQLF